MRQTTMIENIEFVEIKTIEPNDVSTYHVYTVSANGNVRQFVLALVWVSWFDCYCIHFPRGNILIKPSTLELILQAADTFTKEVCKAEE